MSWDGQQVSRDQTATSDPGDTDSFFRHYLYGAYPMPDIVLNTSQVVNPHHHPVGRRFYGPCFTHEDIESPQG